MSLQYGRCRQRLPLQQVSLAWKYDSIAIMAYLACKVVVLGAGRPCRVRIPESSRFFESKAFTTCSHWIALQRRGPVVSSLFGIPVDGIVLLALEWILVDTQSCRSDLEVDSSLTSSIGTQCMPC
ncbi:hypothetical protein KCU93_g279, partial [Aureobasidium melanogenum]